MGNVKGPIDPSRNSKDMGNFPHSFQASLDLTLDIPQTFLL